MSYIYIQLDHVIMEADKSQDLKGSLASWSPRRADMSSSMKVNSLEIQEESLPV